MRRAENDPLPFGLWLSELGALSRHCVSAIPGDEDKAVWRAFHLFKLSPPAIRSLADPYLDESSLELALERDGAEAATRMIAGKRACFALRPTRADSLRTTAEIAFDHGPSVSGEGTSPAYAMIGAWANFFMTVR